MQGGTIHGSINLPAQTLHPTIPTLYTLFSAAKIEKVIWYCGKSISKLRLGPQWENSYWYDLNANLTAGSSRGRGNRAAGWFADFIAEKGDTLMKSQTLEEGIKGWAVAGEEYVKLMDEYDEAVWTK